MVLRCLGNANTNIIRATEHPARIVLQIQPIALCGITKYNTTGAIKQITVNFATGMITFEINI